MTLYYRILHFSAQEHSFTVRYYSDILTENALAIEYNVDGTPKLTPEGYPVRCKTDYNISLYNNYDPKPEDLMKLIKQNSPAEWFKLHDKIHQDKTSFSYVLDLVHTTGTIDNDK